MQDHLDKQVRRMDELVDRIEAALARAGGHDVSEVPPSGRQGRRAHP
ncbi:hypothetical protein ACQ4WX_25655 [Streptomyces lasalocidi]